MARKKTKYDLLLKSLEIPNGTYYWDWDWGYYDLEDLEDLDDNYYNYYDVEYEYLDNIESDYVHYLGCKRGGRPQKVSSYRRVDMESIYTKEKKREIKINKILGIYQEFKPMTFSDLIKKNI